ncbi:hypothetical protein [Myceligenerans crystallogenes]
MSAGPNAGTSRGPAAPGRRERGQAAVELVGVVFTVVLVAVLAIQGITVAQAASIAQEAARHGARALSLGQDCRGVLADHVPDGITIVDGDTTCTVDDDGAVVALTVSVPLGLGDVTMTEVVLTRSAEFPVQGDPPPADEPAPSATPEEEA